MNSKEKLRTSRLAMFGFGISSNAYMDRLVKPYRIHIVIAVVIIAIAVIGFYYLIDRRTILKYAESTGWVNVTVKFNLTLIAFRHYVVNFQNGKGTWFRKHCIVNPLGIDWRECD
jgi:uncharacterized BrkB/YihY/UPF0761 family membrane protein